MTAERGSPLKRIGWGALYLLWVGLLGYYFFGGKDAAGGLKGPEDILRSAKIEPEESWMGIYIKQMKVGYVRTDLAPLEGGGYSIDEVSQMKINMMGREQSMRMRMHVVTDSVLALTTFDGELEAAPYNTGFKGSHKEQVLTIALTTSGKTTEKYLPAPEPIYLSQAIKPLLCAGRLGTGDSLKLSSFDPVSMQMQSLIITGSDLRKQKVAGKNVLARELITRMDDITSLLYVDEEGNSLLEVGPMGLTLKREEMSEALALDESGAGIVDFLTLFAIRPTGTIEGDPQRVTNARYRVEGVSVEQLVAASARQVSIGDSVVEVTTDTPSPALIPPDLEFSKEAPFIESDDPGIRKAAEEAVTGGTTRLDSLQRLTKWVRWNVQKKPSAGLPSALAVLKERTGDCNEHSVLFTAMARSLGIPCKIELGVVYIYGRFCYHAWVAAWGGDRWVELDPTFGEWRADAARIALASGDMSNASQLAGSIGNIKIEILHTESHSHNDN